MAFRLNKGVASVTRETSDVGFIAARGTRDGALFTADWVDGLIMEGRVFGVNNGTLTSPATFSGAMANNEAEIVIDIPDGTIGIPLSIEFTLSTGTTGLSEMVAIASSTLGETSSGASLTVYNMRMDAPFSTQATATGSVTTGGNTSPYSGNYIEFFRDGYGTDPSVTGTPPPVYRWSAKKSGFFPIIVDGGSIMVFAGEAASTGFITVTWAELPEGYIK